LKSMQQMFDPAVFRGLSRPISPRIDLIFRLPAPSPVALSLAASHR
jgi:hypothetical protein